MCGKTITCWTMFYDSHLPFRRWLSVHHYGGSRREGTMGNASTVYPSHEQSYSFTPQRRPVAPRSTSYCVMPHFPILTRCFAYWKIAAVYAILHTANACLFKTVKPLAHSTKKMHFMSLPHEYMCKQTMVSTMEKLTPTYMLLIAFFIYTSIQILRLRKY